MASRAVSIRTGVRSPPRRMRRQASTVHPRHQDVEDDGVGGPGLECVQRLAAVAGEGDVMAFETEGPLDRLAHGGLVVDHHDAHRGAGLWVNLRGR